MYEHVAKLTFTRSAIRARGIYADAQIKARCILGEVRDRRSRSVDSMPSAVKFIRISRLGDSTVGQLRELFVTDACAGTANKIHTVTVPGFMALPS